MAPFRLGIVGCGKIVGHHLRGLADQSAAFRLVAVADPSASARQQVIEQCPAPALVEEFASLDEMLAPAADRGPRVEVVLICVPHDLHEPLAVQALEHGVFVVLEKPLATDVAACHRILDAANRSKLGLFVAENSPYWPEVIEAKRLVQSGAIGELLSLHAHYYESLVDTPFGGSQKSETDPYDLGWRQSLERCGGGVTIDGGLHWLRPLRIFGGDVVRVVGSTSRKGFPSMEGESISHVLLEFASGVKATFRTTVLPQTRMSSAEPWFRIIGSTGEINIHADFDGGMTLYDSQSPSGRAVDMCNRAPGGFTGSFVHEWRHIAECSRAAAEESNREARTDIAVVQAIYRSLDSSVWEPVAPSAGCSAKGIHPPPNALMTRLRRAGVAVAALGAAFWAGTKRRG